MHRAVHGQQGIGDIFANTTLLSAAPIASPTTKVIASPIPNVVSFGCAVIKFTILSFNDIHFMYHNKLYKYSLLNIFER